MFNLEVFCDHLRQLGAMRDMLVIKLRANIKEEVTQFRALDNIYGLSVSSKVSG